MTVCGICFAYSHFSYSCFTYDLSHFATPLSPRLKFFTSPISPTNKFIKNRTHYCSGDFFQHFWEGALGPLALGIF